MNVLNLILLSILVGTAAKFFYLVIGSPEGVELHNYKSQSASRLKSERMLLSALGKVFLKWFNAWEVRHLKRLSASMGSGLTKWDSQIKDPNTSDKEKQELIQNIHLVLEHINKKRRTNPFKALVCEFCLSTWACLLIWAVLFGTGVVPADVAHLIISPLLVTGAVMTARYLK